MKTNNMMKAACLMLMASATLVSADILLPEVVELCVALTVLSVLLVVLLVLVDDVLPQPASIPSDNTQAAIIHIIFLNFIYTFPFFIYSLITLLILL